ncbi:MAG TPA: GNAT family N-acetyltransferase [Anaerolineales bacterium]|nr:GNAT family N-acetyltransferase [Anaerolineales bacterium]
MNFPFFSQSWWLEAIAPGAWGEVLVEKGGTLYARLPYVSRRKWGLRILDMPPLTQTLGPWLRPHAGKYASRLGEEKELMTELIERLPPFDIFQQRFHPSITNWLPFYWKGFEQTTRYSYVIEKLTDLDSIWEGLEKSVRTSIRKAEKEVIVRDDLGLDKFVGLEEMVFKRQGRALPYSVELLERLDQACLAHNCRRMFFAEDAHGSLHAAAYIIWDDQSAYYLMGGGDPELRGSGASSLCLWRAIKFAGSVTSSFDFEGSMLEDVEHFFRAFGAKQRPYFDVRKINSTLVGAAFDLWLRTRHIYQRGGSR